MVHKNVRTFKKEVKQQLYNGSSKVKQQLYIGEVKQQIYNGSSKMSGLLKKK
jgi:hypothetical protein